MELKELTARFERACEKGREAERVFAQSDRDEAFPIYEQAIAEVDAECECVGALAEQHGYTIDEVARPLWS